MSTTHTAHPLQKTPLHAQHVALGAKMVPFGGWEMPLQYAGILQEHHAVRREVGLFDVSHMGEFHISGPEAAPFVQRMVGNDVLKLAADQALYTQMMRPDGGTVDDLLVYRQPDGYLLVVNASNIDKDWSWLEQYKPREVTMVNQSAQTAMLAVQGPRAAEMMQRLTPVASLGSFRWCETRFAERSVRIARTGYTGEDGFEIFCDAGDAPAVWDALLAGGEPFGIQPCGLGARDTLRLEAGLPLYGHELSEVITPVMAGLSWSVKPNKGDFLGREALLSQLGGNLTHRVVALEFNNRVIARQGYRVFCEDQLVGEVLSGTFSPTLQVPVATALVDHKFAQSALSVEIRGQLHPANTTRLPFYRRPNR